MTSQPNKLENTEVQLDITELIKNVNREKSTDILIKRPNEISQDTILSIVTNLANKFKIPPETALKGIFVLILRGAANLQTPLNLKAILLNTKGEEVTIRKEDLLYEYKFATGNNFLRRLADTLANDISEFAEINQMDGEIAQKVNNMVLRDGGSPLTPIERAWCSSFNQNNSNLFNKAKTQRLATLLAKNLYETNKTIKKDNHNQGKLKSSPRPQGPGKKSKGGQKRIGK